MKLKGKNDRNSLSEDWGTLMHSLKRKNTLFCTRFYNVLLQDIAICLEIPMK